MCCIPCGIRTLLCKGTYGYIPWRNSVVAMTLGLAQGCQPRLIWRSLYPCRCYVSGNKTAILAIAYWTVDYGTSNPLPSIPHGYRDCGQTLKYPCIGRLQTVTLTRRDRERPRPSREPIGEQARGAGSSPGRAECLGNSGRN